MGQNLQQPIIPIEYYYFRLNYLKSGWAAESLGLAHFNTPVSTRCAQCSNKPCPSRLEMSKSQLGADLLMLSSRHPTVLGASNFELRGLLLSVAMSFSKACAVAFFLLSYCVGHAESVYIWSSPGALPTKIPAACRAALSQNITCNPSLLSPNWISSNRYIEPAYLTEYCTSSCLASINVRARDIPADVPWFVQCSNKPRTS